MFTVCYMKQKVFDVDSFRINGVIPSLGQTQIRPNHFHVFHCKRTYIDMDMWKQLFLTVLLWCRAVNRNVVQHSHETCCTRLGLENITKA